LVSWNSKMNGAQQNYSNQALSRKFKIYSHHNSKWDLAIQNILLFVFQTFCKCLELNYWTRIFIQSDYCVWCILMTPMYSDVFWCILMYVMLAIEE
jgi:hypothetical protein